MTDRPTPRYGEYASPEEQRAQIRDIAAFEAASGTTPPPPAADTRIASGTGAAARPPAKNRTVDRIVTIALLAFGLFTVVTTIPQLLDYTAFADLFMQYAGISGTFTNVAEGEQWGTIASIAFAVGWALTALIAGLWMRVGRLAWWIPLVGAVVTTVIVTICLTFPLLNDPAIRAGMGA